MKVRILQIEKGTDQIRIGISTEVKNINLLGKKTMEAYRNNLKWCQLPTEEALKKFYSKISIVDAESLKTIKVLYENN